MADRKRIVLDGNEAAVSVAHRLSEVIAIYPITPSSTMGELADEWSAREQKNIWGTVPSVYEMQSEGGAAGAVHGALQAGAMSTTFTASQGLLLMIPNMYKIAGELSPFCMHVSARTIATHALSIFGDHSDVMACRQTGFALLASADAQEAHDSALIAHAATLKSRIPFLHFFDGFRTSHELTKVEMLTDDDLKSMIDEDLVGAHKDRALTPDRPVLRGSAQNPDVFFQAREAVNGFYDICPYVVKETMREFFELTGRSYGLFDYYGHPEAEKVIVIMGSGAHTARETAAWLAARGKKVGVVQVRLYRPFAVRDFIEVLPSTVRSIAVLDRTKEPGATGEPLFLDVVAALHEAEAEGWTTFSKAPRVIGGRYGLSSKEFTPAMVNAVFEEMDRPSPRRRFTVGINDDVTRLSLSVDDAFDIESDHVVQAVFYGLGSDGTVGANKNSIKIIGEEADRWAQGYFVYDSKKAGAVTISHLRFGPDPIHAPYLIRKAGFVACHQYPFLDRFDVLEFAAPGGTFLLNAPYSKDQVWDHLPVEVQERILELKLRFFVIDAYKVAAEAEMGRRINTVMQTCFFAISGVLPREEAIEQIKKAIYKTYGKRGEVVVQKNYAAVDLTLANLHEVAVPAKITTQRRRPPIVVDEAPDFVKRVNGVMLAGKGDLLPVSAFPPDGTWPMGTARWEKRAIALDIPVWDESICIQCNKCALVCPHAAIRAKIYDPEQLAGHPTSFKSVDFRSPELSGYKYTIQVAPEDCTGCTLCVMVCPAKDKTNPRHKAIDMAPMADLRDTEKENFGFFLDLPEFDRSKLKLDVKGSQFLEPLFEYSGACAGCGETPYVKLMTQLFGDRALVANATGCSSIYGGNLPTTPYTTNRDGRGPAWSNSLFEDNAEFGFGFRLAVDSVRDQALGLVRTLSSKLGDELVRELLEEIPGEEGPIARRRSQVQTLREKLSAIDSLEAARLHKIADYLVPKSVWIVGGDGWAYDIGYGGLDHVLASGKNVNILVLDTEVYSNTGGQQSKSTPLGAAARFAVSGKATAKKDLALMALSYGNVYVARVAFGAKDAQTVKAFQEADSFNGPSLILAYSHCIAHGYDMAFGVEQQKLAVDSGYWPLYRFDPRNVARGQSPLHLDSGEAKIDISKFERNEQRFLMVEQQNPARFKELMGMARKQTAGRYSVYEKLAELLKPEVEISPVPPGSPRPVSVKGPVNG